MSVEDLSNSSSNRHKSIKLVWRHEDGETQEVENREEELKRGDLGLWTNWSGVNPLRACD